MARINSERGLSSNLNEDFDAIELCPCVEDDNLSSQPSVFSSMPLYNSTWEPIIIYRKNKRKRRTNSARCPLHTPRLLQKSGRTSPLLHTRVPLRYARYLRDLSNTVVNARWRWVTLILVLAVAGLWLLFAWLWMLIAATHGDLEPIAFRRNDTCSEGVEGFAGFLLLSVETQTTIGYGSRYPTENCPEGVLILCLQMIIGIGVEGAVLGMFYIKMTRPRIRDCRKLFSKIAVISQRDGNLCLMFRLSDHERSHIVGTQVRAWLSETWRMSSGVEGAVEALEARQQPLQLQSLGLLLWPLTVVHCIDSKSPLYDISARDLLIRKFEIIVTMIGSSDSTGQLTQSRTSYLSSEIHWGHRFRPCVHYDDSHHGYVVHQELLSATEQVDTPLCSARRLDEVLGEIRIAAEKEGTITSGIGSMTECSSPVEGTLRMDEVLETCV